MFRVAIPNKGSLSATATQMLVESGYRQRKDERQLVLQDPDNQVEFFYLRPRDIAIYIGSGTLDAGITGLDLMLDSGSDAVKVEDLGFAKSSFRLAVPVGSNYRELADLNGARIATSYAKLLEDYLAKQGIRPQKIVRLDGAIESSIQLGVADVIADVVSTGTTLRQAGLEIFGDPILESEAILIRSPKTDADSEELRTLVHRLQGVIAAREYVLMDFDIPTALVEAARKIAPGFEAPTVSELSTGGGRSDGAGAGAGAGSAGSSGANPSAGAGSSGQKWSAVRVMVDRKNMNQVMDDLYRLGARAILVTQILASRL